ncbi:chromosome segregation protein SMC [Mesorhizobium sp. M7A.T.Ca.TU.009.01.3.1]|nr:chromosome segregation protein SMC [Mesorhizobium sp. M7A.T.Ca.TU.009.01.3.1]
MKFERVEIAGFRGFRDPADIPLGAAFTVIQGANGAGKSTICDAIEFCLTGTLTKFLIDKAANEQAADYLWWRGERKAPEHFVRLHLRMADGTVVSITRDREGCDKTEDEIRMIFANANAPVDALQVLIETTIIRDESIAALSLDTSDTDRYRRVQRALGAISTEPLLVKAAEVASSLEEVSRKNEASVEAARREIASLVTQQSVAQSRLASTDQSNSATAFLREQLNLPMGSVSDLVSKAREGIASSQSWLVSAQAAHNRARQLSSEIAELDSDSFRDDLNNHRLQVERLSDEAKRTLDTYSQAEKFLTAQRNAETWAASYARLLDHGLHVGLQDGHCPLCMAARTEDEFGSIIASTKRKLDEQEELTILAELEVSEAQTHHNDVSEKLNIALVELGSLEAREQSRRRIQDQLLKLAGEVGFDLPDLVDPARFAAIVEQRRTSVLRLDQSARLVSQSLDQTRLSEMEQNLKAVQAELDRFQVLASRSRRALEDTKSIDHAIKRTAGEIVDERLAAISPLLSQLYLRLRPHADWRNIEYRIRGDVRKFLSLSVGDDLNPQFVFSSGQRRITGLAFLLSVHLSRAWTTLNSLILDDPVQHIDDYRALNLVEVLSSIRMSGKQVICAVEDSSLADLLSRRLRGTQLEPGRRIVIHQDAGGVSRVAENRTVISSQKRVLDSLVEAIAS